MRIHRRSGPVPVRLAAVLAATALVAAACGSDDSDDAADPTTGAATETTAGAAPETTADAPSATSADTAADAPSADGEIVVFAAASLTEAYTELGEAFSAANPDASVTFNFAASSELVTQIANGAPADVFASADMNNMTKLTDAGDNDGEPVVFATNRSEIIVAPDNPLGITGVEGLTDPDLTVVVCAPEVPCGNYAAEIFANAGVEVTPASYEENVKAVVTKVTLGEADAGIAYATDVIAAGDEASGVEIPDDINVIAEYPIAVTAEAGNDDGARAFIDYVLGADGQEILASYGFTAP